MLIATGCVSGPLRYKTLGNHTYGTVEFTKRATPIVKPVAAAAGLVTDAGLIATDSVITPIISIPYSIIASASFGTFGMGNNRGAQRVCLSFILIPAVMYEFGCGNIDESMGFGRDAIWLKNNEAKIPESKQVDTESGGRSWPIMGQPQLPHHRTCGSASGGSDQAARDKPQPHD